MGVNGILSQDMAWYDSITTIRPSSENQHWREHFVGTVIDWSYPDQADRQFYKNRYKQEIVRACKKLKEASGKPVILYNQVGDGKGKSHDEILIKEICSLSDGTAIFCNEPLTPEILRERLHFAKGVMASRFHSALFSIQAVTPFITLAYQPKASYILKDLDIAELSRSITTFDGEEVAAALIEMDRNRNDFVRRITMAKQEAMDLLDRTFVDQLRLEPAC